MRGGRGMESTSSSGGNDRAGGGDGLADSDELEGLDAGGGDGKVFVWPLVDAAAERAAIDERGD